MPRSAYQTWAHKLTSSLAFLLVRHGLAPSDVTPISTGSQNAAIAALERGRLDALSNFDPAVSQVLKRHPNVRILADARTQEVFVNFSASMSTRVPSCTPRRTG